MLDVADLDADTVAAFLDHLQTKRGIVAAIHNMLKLHNHWIANSA
jgi:hypothetical protein